MSFESSLLSSLDAGTFRTMIIHQQPPQNYIWHPIANKPYSLNCWNYSVVYKKSCSQLMIIVYFSIWKIIIPRYCAPLSHLTSCTPTKSNLYLANSLVAAASEPAPYRLLTFHVPNLMSHFCCLDHTKGWNQVRGKCSWFASKSVFTARICQRLPQPPSWRTNSLSAVRDCLFNIFAATLHIGGHSSNHNLRKRHAMKTGTHLLRISFILHCNNCVTIHTINNVKFTSFILTF